MVFLFDLTMPEILRRILAGLIHAGLQGFLLALLLWLLGDPRAREQGRMTLNPILQLNLGGMALCVALRVSWITPMPRGGRGWRPLAAVLASLALLLALVPLLDLARAPLHAWLPRGAGYLVLASIDTLQFVLVGSALLALLPLPGMLLGDALPALFPRLARRWRKLGGIGMALAAALVLTGWFPAVKPLVEALRLV